VKIYVASSWRNGYQPDVVAFLRQNDHEVYDFRNPAPGNDGFNWREIDPGWRDWTIPQYVAALNHPIAQAGFGLDMNALRWCDACVLVLPCGRSAHLEAGWAAGAGKQVVIYAPNPKEEPELMYLMTAGVVTTMPHILGLLRPVTSAAGPF
jgi:hypothetical protein